MTRISKHFPEKFSREGDFVVIRQGLMLGGAKLPIGSPFPKDRITERRLRQLYEQRFIGRPNGFTSPKKPRRIPDYDAIVENAFIRANARLAAAKLAAKKRRGEVIQPVAVAVPEPLVEPEPEPIIAQPIVDDAAVPSSYSPSDMDVGDDDEKVPEEALPDDDKADFLGRRAAAKKKERQSR